MRSITATNPKLQKRLNELKAKSGFINYMNFPINERKGKVTESYFQEKLDQRIICGYGVTWNNKNSHSEKVIKGSASRSINVRGPKSNAKYKITFLWMHKQEDPLSLMATIEEDDFGLYFETAPLDDVPNSDRCIKQIRSGTLNQFSIGFDYVWDKIEYDEKDDCLVLLDIDLFEISVVTIGSDQNTCAKRSIEQITDLHEEIEDFILTLPRENRSTARTLFTRQKALIDLTSDEEEEPKKEQFSWETVLNHL